MCRCERAVTCVYVSEHVCVRVCVCVGGGKGESKGRKTNTPFDFFINLSVLGSQLPERCALGVIFDVFPDRRCHYSLTGLGCRLGVAHLRHRWPSNDEFPPVENTANMEVCHLPATDPDVERQVDRIWPVDGHVLVELFVDRLSALRGTEGGLGQGGGIFPARGVDGPDNRNRIASEFDHVAVVVVHYAHQVREELVQNAAKLLSAVALRVRISTNPLKINTRAVSRYCRGRRIVKTTRMHVMGAYLQCQSFCERRKPGGVGEHCRASQGLAVVHKIAMPGAVLRGHTRDVVYARGETAIRT